MKRLWRYYCDFCGKREDADSDLFAANKHTEAAICQSCVARCNESIAKRLRVRLYAIETRGEHG